MDGTVWLQCVNYGLRRSHCTGRASRHELLWPRAAHAAVPAPQASTGPGVRCRIEAWCQSPARAAESMRVRMAQDVWTLQPVREHERLVVEKRPCRSVRDDSAAIEDDRALADLDHELEVV
jgi:hypothetical protein